MLCMMAINYQIDSWDIVADSSTSSAVGGNGKKKDEEKRANVFVVMMRSSKPATLAPAPPGCQ